MSNILIIKHGSLGDIVQISGVLRDIRLANKDKKIFILTTAPYAALLSICPFINFVLIDKRLPRWNIIYLIKLKKMMQKYNFSHIYDLQNSTRTSFYRKYLFRNAIWSSTETTLKKGTKKKDFKESSILDRFVHQLENSDIKTNYTLKPDFSWASVNIDQILNKFFNKKYIVIFPFSSLQLKHKRWPYYKELIHMIKSNHDFEIVIAPGPDEIDEANEFGAVVITHQNKILNIQELSGLIAKSEFVISNDTGPAHIAAHMGKRGVVLFGSHTTPKKVSIETEKFKAIPVDNLKNLKAEEIYSKVKDQLKLID